MSSQNLRLMQVYQKIISKNVKSQMNLYGYPIYIHPIHDKIFLKTF